MSRVIFRAWTLVELKFLHIRNPWAMGHVTVSHFSPCTGNLRYYSKRQRWEVHIWKSQDDNAIQLLSVTIAAINTTKDIVPVGLAKGILGTITGILTIVQSMIKNRADFSTIIKKCDTIRRVLERATKEATDDDLQGSLGYAISEPNG
ncbi:hypothetical protein M405DRAFT_866417 [Rhizopogon salebrosus TDB-379]|nr:hypothetical protein M405DRAFT_866417 [Rhizopogon salebrosus TDB-379]